MNVADLSEEELFLAFHEVTVELCPENDHEEGIDGLGKNVKHRVLNCTIANGGKNIICAHCTEYHFPAFPGLAVVERTIEFLDITREEKDNLLFALSTSTAMISAMDRIRILSLRPEAQVQSEMYHMIELLNKIDHAFVKERIAIMHELIALGASIFETNNTDMQQRQKAIFLKKFRAEKMIITRLRKDTLEKIKKYVPHTR